MNCSVLNPARWHSTEGTTSQSTESLIPKWQFRVSILPPQFDEENPAVQCKSALRRNAETVSGSITPQLHNRRVHPKHVRCRDHFSHPDCRSIKICATKNLLSQVPDFAQGYTGAFASTYRWSCMIMLCVASSFGVTDSTKFM